MRRFAGIAAFALLGACSLGLSSKAPPFLLTLTPDAMPPANNGAAVNAADVLIVAVPLVPQAIAVNRIPVAQGDTVIAYIKDAIWIEPPARMFQRLVAETVRARTGRPVLDLRQGMARGGATLSGQLLRFDIDERRAEAVAVFEAALTGGNGQVLKARRFEAREAAGAIDARSAGTALNRAANRVAQDVAAWIGTSTPS